MIAIELVYIDGCPSWECAGSTLGCAIVTTGNDATVRLRNMERLS